MGHWARGQVCWLTFSDATGSPNATNMSARKRKASEEPSDMDRMSTSPAGSPSVTNRSFSSSSALRSIKRTRTGIAGGRPLTLPRLLQTLSADEMRELLQNVCSQHPGLQQDIVKQAPRPSVESTLAVLGSYEDSFQEAFPYGTNKTSDYAYNRVHHHLFQLIEALRDFTPHFLPPHETLMAHSVAYLDAVTNMIHRLPEWDSYQNQRHKNDAYDEISKAWALVMREGAKRAGGFHLQFEGWDRKLLEHNQRSGGKLEEAIHQVRTIPGFATSMTPPPTTPSLGLSNDRAKLREQLFGGTYGQQLGVGPGRW